MNRSLLLVALLLLAPLLAPLAAGSHPGACALGTPLGRRTVDDYYVEQRANGDIWVYEETNFVPSLQRGGDGPFGSDHCVDDPLVIPDAIVL